jgi:hypothetical protein
MVLPSSKAAKTAQQQQIERTFPVRSSIRAGIDLSVERRNGIAGAVYVASVKRFKKIIAPNR